MKHKIKEEIKNANSINANKKEESLENLKPF